MLNEGIHPSVSGKFILSLVTASCLVLLGKSAVTGLLEKFLVF
jgi:hypothetical protein